MLQTISTYFKTHERLLLALIGGVALWFAIGRVDTLIANHDNANLKQAQVVASQQAEKNQALAAQATEQAVQYQALAAKVDAENAALVQANATLSAALVKQQKTDATLPPTELVARLNTLVPQADATVTPTGVALPEAGAIATVQQLEQVPVLNSELSNTKEQLENVDSLLKASTGQVATLTDEVSGLKLEAVDSAKVCTAQIATVKAEARRSKRRWFVAGFVAGIATRILGHF
jgi:hypothetical protein